jgi:hypothetical protein
MTAAQPQATAPITKMPPKIVSREIAFVVLLKICGMFWQYQPTPPQQIPCRKYTSGFGII